MAAVRGERRVDRHDVGGGEQLRRRTAAPPPPRGSHPPARTDRVVTTRKPSAVILTASARAMRPNPTRPSVRPRRRWSGAGVRRRPGARPHLPVEQRHAARERQDQGECVIRHLVDAVVRHVRDEDALLGRLVEVDRVEPDAVAGDHDASIEPADDLRRHLRVAVQHGVGPRDGVADLLDRGRVRAEPELVPGLAEQIAAPDPDPGRRDR